MFHQVANVWGSSSCKVPRRLLPTGASCSSSVLAPSHGPHPCGPALTSSWVRSSLPFQGTPNSAPLEAVKSHPQIGKWQGGIGREAWESTKGMAAGLTQVCSYKACSIYVSSDFTGNFDSWHCVSEETETQMQKVVLKKGTPWLVSTWTFSSYLVLRNMEKSQHACSMCLAPYGRRRTKPNTCSVCWTLFPALSTYQPFQFSWQPHEMSYSIL